MRAAASKHVIPWIATLRVPFGSGTWFEGDLHILVRPSGETMPTEEVEDGLLPKACVETSARAASPPETGRPGAIPEGVAPREAVGPDVGVADVRARDIQVGEALRWAARFFHHHLTQSQEAQAYLARRGVRAETARSFGLGYAPEAWDTLLSTAEWAGFDRDVIHRAGLITRRSDGRGFYDVFRHRILFPFLEGAGCVTGFAGRTLEVVAREEGAPPKYLNTRTTTCYKKAEALYRHVEAEQAIQEAGWALVVEGYMDVVTLHQAGVRNVVGTGGAGMTSAQAFRLGLLTGQVTLLYDGDRAGIEASERAAEALLAQGIEVRVGALPIGLDPDRLVRQRGAGFLKSRILEPSPSIVAYTLERQGGNVGSASRLEALSTLVRRLALCPAGPVREGYLAEMVSRTGLPPGTIRSSIALLESAPPA